MIEFHGNRLQNIPMFDDETIFQAEQVDNGTLGFAAAGIAVHVDSR